MRLLPRAAAVLVIAILTLTGGVAFSATAGAAAGPPPAVRAADLSAFRAGHIISDPVFFNSSTMSEGQIQSFLEARVPSCRAGYTCLKDWRDTSRTTTADAMCGPYQGAANERASTIIFKVAQACGINPQVILATLEKEQGLVTHVWPSEWRYTAAMGQGCPDTAACDTRYYGFFNQVYGAAWQFKRYANPPGTSQYFTWYAPGKTWNIRYHPEVSCGSSPVFVENQATANLYYYTPYQPNAASLRAGYGEGDGCSSYGNRNFYQKFTDWFGSTISFAVSGAIATAWNAQGGASGWLGYATAPMQYSPVAGGGWYQYFQNGIIYVVQSGPTTILRTGSVLAQQYMVTGGPSGWLGWPIAGEACGTYGCAVTYQGGMSAWSNRTGAIQQVNGAIQSSWLAGGGVNNPVGVPAAGMQTVGGSAPGWYQRFDAGHVFAPVQGASRSLSSASGITQRYMELGGPSSRLGWPRADEQCGTAGCALELDAADLAWSPGIGIVETSGPIRTGWKQAGGVTGWMGAPIGAITQGAAAPGGQVQRFTAAFVYAPSGRDIVVLRSGSGITQRYEAAGGSSGGYGWPVAAEQCGVSVCSTEFANATIVWDAALGMHDVVGALRAEYTARGGFGGVWGAPASDVRNHGTGVSQEFRAAWAYLKSGATVVTLRPDSGLARHYRDVLGGPAGTLGWPRGEETCDEAECRIVFDSGTLAWNRVTGVISRR